MGAARSPRRAVGGGPVDPLGPGAFRAAAGATALVVVAALVGAAVRILPWILDPQIAWATLAPFAKSLGAVAVEAAVLTGWPVGWALATGRLVERGEARVLATLGESPLRTLVRLAPQAAVFVAILASTSLALGREAAAPGGVVDALLAEGRVACEKGRSPSTRGVPFVSATWLCDGSASAGSPRLVGKAPLGGVVFTARDAHVSDDLRRIELADARLALPAPGGTNVRVHVGTLVLRGMAPWARAASLPPSLRAIVVTVSGLAAAFGAVYAVLRVRRRGSVEGSVAGIAAVSVGGAGALAALVTLRALELRMPDVGEPGHARWLGTFAFVPIAALVAVAVATAIVTLLPVGRRTGSK